MPTSEHGIPTGESPPRYIAPDDAVEVVEDPGGFDWTCGQCSRVLIRGMDPLQAGGLVIKCPGCGAFNQQPV